LTVDISFESETRLPQGQKYANTTLFILFFFLQFL
jgi:hypothetical protein